MTRTRRPWWAFGIGALLLMLTLAWISWVVIDLEAAGTQARAQAEYQESLRLALWRMESRLTPLTVREVARPYFQYRSYYPQQRAYNRILQALEPGEILTPSPLLGFDSERIRLHFQIDPQGEISSPQVPQGEMHRLARASGLGAEELASKRLLLEELRPLLPRDEVLLGVERAEAAVARALEVPTGTEEPVAVAPLSPASKSQAEFQKRAQGSSYCQAPLGPGSVNWDLTDGSSLIVGPLVPLWLPQHDDADPHLVFVRRVTIGNDSYLQGFLADWPFLKQDLEAEAQDLFARVHLRPILEADRSASTEGLLATIPAVLEVEALAASSGPLATPARITVAISWLLAWIAVGAVALTLRSGIAFAERRRRFVSAVTHELRTPLTTFRMYSEMLADGMIEDPAKRREYLLTLRDESVRLGSIVENVLSYARVEEGKGARPPRRISAEALLEQIRQPLQRRAESCGATFGIVRLTGLDGQLDVDVDSVEQILFNLVDNACKYGTSEAAAKIRLSVEVANEFLVLEVQDQGPGVPPGQESRIFQPFERGTQDAVEGRSGVGLGLALARDLARSLGGDLALVSRAGEGAHFQLRLPGYRPQARPAPGSARREVEQS